ncbi:transposase domain-containing protein [Acinetobacter baumannii]|nr:transposase domain-containing protein [Acinetobacter baumannii]
MKKIAFYLAKRCLLDPYAYLSDVLKRLPTHKVTQIEELLPHCWKPKSN